MSRVDVGGFALHTRVDGPDRAPWIVLSNSLGSNLSMWDDQIDLLTRQYRVLCCLGIFRTFQLKPFNLWTRLHMWVLFLVHFSHLKSLWSG